MSELTKKQKEKQAAWRENLRFIVLLLVIWAVIFVITRFFYGFIVVDGDSMNNTMYNNQVGIIQRFDKQESIKKGDIIVFYSDELQEYLIKRCVATGGDTLSMKDGILTVNGKVVKEDYIKEPMVSDNNFKKITLKKNELFAMGDNRNNSMDCRALGPVKMKKVSGRLVINLGKYGVTKKRVIVGFAVVFVLLIAIGVVSDLRNKDEDGEESETGKETDSVPEEYRDFPIELDSGTCTGEKTIGFRNPATGKLEQMELVKTKEDIIRYCKKYKRDYDNLV